MHDGRYRDAPTRAVQGIPVMRFRPVIMRFWPVIMRFRPVIMRPC